MKKILFYILLIPSSLIAQNSDYFNINIPVSFSSIQSSLHNAGLDGIQYNDSGLDIEKIINILSLNVKGYFDFDSEAICNAELAKYNTELKLTMFKESDEYKQMLKKINGEYNQKLEELKELRETIKSNFFYIDLLKYNISYWPLPPLYINSISDYNINKGGFFFLLGLDELKFKELKAIGIFELKPFPFDKLDDIYEIYNRKLFPMSFFLPMSKIEGLKFEDIRSKIKATIIFKPCMVKNYKYGDNDYKLIAINKLRFIISEPETNTVYFDKVFSIEENTTNNKTSLNK